MGHLKRTRCNLVQSFITNLFDPGCSLRKATGHKLIIFSIWLVYLLADWAAAFGVGLIAERVSNSQTPTENTELFVFWAPFLLLHLGGPDTITAFAREDNELWLRHLFGFVFQTAYAFYIFLLSLPNKLCFPTILVFITGIIKCFERIRALYLASNKKFTRSTSMELDKIDYSWLQRNLFVTSNHRDYHEVACHYFKILKAVADDRMPSFEGFFEKVAVDHAKPTFVDYSPEEALRIIEVELNLLYEVFHTKIQVTHSVLGIILRFICFGSVAAALSVFYFLVEKRAGFNEFDVGVTYILLMGAIALDIISFFMRFFSAWILTDLSNHHFSRIAAIVGWFLKFKSSRWRPSHSTGGRHNMSVFATPFPLRRWSGSLSGLSLLKSRPTEKCDGIDQIFSDIAVTTYKVIQFLQIDKIIALFGLEDTAEEMRIKTSLSQEPLTKELWEFLFNTFKRSARPTPLSPWSRANLDAQQIIQSIENRLNSRFARIPFDSATILKWHLATTKLLYDNPAEEVSNVERNAREHSKILSDYVLYLAFLKPNLVRSDMKEIVNGWETLRAEAKRWLEKTERSEPNSFKNQILFNDTETLVDLLLSDDYKHKKWEIVRERWVEILERFASPSSIGRIPMIQQLSHGGEFITFVWALQRHIIFFS